MSNAPKWAGKLDFMKSAPVTVEIEGKEYQFHKLNISLILELKSLLPKVSKPLALLFGNDSKSDFGQKTRTIQSGKPNTDDYTSTTEVVMEPSTVELVTLRSKQKKEGVDELAKLLSDPLIEELVYKVIRQSMRDYFDPANTPPASEFFENLEATAAVDIFKGIVKANEKLFKPFLSTVQTVQERLQTALKDKLKTEEANEDELETKEEISGTSSEKKSSTSESTTI